LVVNPQYRQLTYQIKKSKEKKTRRQAKVYEKMQQHSNKTIDQVEQDIAQTTDLIDEVLDYEEQITQLKIAPISFRNAKKEGRALIREIFKSQADVKADYENKTLTIKIHTLSTPRNNEALKHLCALMNETKTIYPHTNLQMVFETIAK